jgi:hypothetical protein
MKCLKNLDSWSGGGWGVFIALNQPRHPTVRVLTVSTVGALSSCCTGQSGAAPDSPVLHRTCTVHCPVRLLVAALTLRELSAHCSCCQMTVGGDRYTG